MFCQNFNVIWFCRRVYPISELLSIDIKNLKDFMNPHELPELGETNKMGTGCFGKGEGMK